MSQPLFLSLRHAALALSCALACAACSSPSDSQTRFHPLAVQPLGLRAPASPPEPEAGQPAVEWWVEMHDAALNRLIDLALANSPTVQVVVARVEAAQAQAMAAGANTGPRLNADADATREHFTANSIYPPPLGGAMYTMGNLQLSGSWELDLFGRNRSRLKAAIGAARAQWADAQAAKLLLTTQLARQYVHLGQLIALRDVAQRSLAQRQAIFDLVRQRVNAGIDTNVEFYQGQETLPQMRQQIESLDEQIALTRHVLAMLTAQAPGALDTLSPVLPDRAWFELPTQVPADLLARRADVQASLWRIEAATQRVKAAQADFYPNINLMAFAGYSTIGFQRLLESNSEQYGWGPAIHLPLFDAGRLRAQLRGSTAELDGAIAAYNDSVLEALRDTADQLASLQSIARQQREQQAAQTSAQQAYDLALQRYRAGLGGYLTVLQAENAVLAESRLRAELQARLQDSSIALVHALGGWPKDLSLSASVHAAPAPGAANHQPL